MTGMLLSTFCRRSLACGVCILSNGSVWMAQTRRNSRFVVSGRTLKILGIGGTTESKRRLSVSMCSLTKGSSRTVQRAACRGKSVRRNWASRRWSVFDRITVEFCPMFRQSKQQHSASKLCGTRRDHSPRQNRGVNVRLPSEEQKLIQL
jgi:hypothetical protein